MRKGLSGLFLVFLLSTGTGSAASITPAEQVLRLAMKIGADPEVRALNRGDAVLAPAKALAPFKPPVNLAFNHRTEPEIPSEATNQPWRRN